MGVDELYYIRGCLGMEISEETWKEEVILRVRALEKQEAYRSILIRLKEQMAYWIEEIDQEDGGDVDAN